MAGGFSCFFITVRRKVAASGAEKSASRLGMETAFQDENR
jgi:hypothetical protein